MSERTALVCFGLIAFLFLVAIAASVGETRDRNARIAEAIKNGAEPRAAACAFDPSHCDGSAR